MGGYRMPDSESAVFLAVTGHMLSLPAFAYSTLLWGGKNARSEHLVSAVNSWAALCAASSAVRFQSPLLGYLTVVAIFCALGFCVQSRGLCYVIGFDSKHVMERCCVASMLL